LSWQLPSSAFPGHAPPFNIAVYTLLPFGFKAVDREDHLGRNDLSTGPLGVIGNIISLVLAG
jgi:uncharacterized membrane protein YccF (DUF307 family)